MFGYGTQAVTVTTHAAEDKYGALGAATTTTERVRIGKKSRLMTSDSGVLVTSDTVLTFRSDASVKPGDVVTMPDGSERQVAKVEELRDVALRGLEVSLA